MGVSNKTVPVEVLERLAVSGEHLPKALASLIAKPNLEEVVVLSTCMRTEVYAAVESFHGGVFDLRSFLEEVSFLPPEEISDHVYSYYGEAAVSHLFEVAAGLHSAVLGEGEVLRQLRDAWATAVEEDACGPLLSPLFRHALIVGKRARAETAISRGTTSLSQAAVELAATHAGAGSSLVIGAGQMGQSVFQALTGRGAQVLVANRTLSRAESLVCRPAGASAASPGGSEPAAASALGLHEVEAALESVGSLYCCMTSPSGDPVVTGEVLAATAERRRRLGMPAPLVVVDLGVPRNVEPSAGLLPGVVLLDIDDVSRRAEGAIARRRRETTGARAIVAEEVGRFLAEVVARSAGPLVARLHGRAEEVRLAELRRFEQRLAGLDESQRAAVEALTRGMVAKWLHEPTVRVKQLAGTPKGSRMAEALRELFSLGE
ncbi:MAG: glutamyl-tRNA reductase [Acidimicrobiales bacterium]